MEDTGMAKDGAVGKRKGSRDWVNAIEIKQGGTLPCANTAVAERRPACMSGARSVSRTASVDLPASTLSWSLNNIINHQNGPP